jgi:hypothetical protein
LPSFIIGGGGGGGGNEQNISPTTSCAVERDLENNYRKSVLNE